MDYRNFHTRSKICCILYVIARFMLISVATIDTDNTEGTYFKGYVTMADRKYLTKGGYYQSAQHYWPFDYETQLRDIKYSMEGSQIGSGISIAGDGRGFLSLNGSGWVNLGKYKNNCICVPRFCRSRGLTVSLWLRIRSNGNYSRRTLFGSSTYHRTKVGAFTILESYRNHARHLTVIVFMDKKKWKDHVPFAEEEDWVFFTVSFEETSGLTLYKNGVPISNRNKTISKQRRFKDECDIALSVPHEQIKADYDDLTIWNYLLTPSNVSDLFKNSVDPPTVKQCNTSDGTSLDVEVFDANNVYEMKNNFRISWRKRGDEVFDQDIINITNYHIPNLEFFSEYEVRLERKISEGVFSKSFIKYCSTNIGVPTQPRDFKVTEVAPDYLFLHWKPPYNTSGNIQGYKISYRVDDFSNSVWKTVFLTDVNSNHLSRLQPFTDYIIKLVCRNDIGEGPEAVIKATTAEAIPSPPRKLLASLRHQSILVKWSDSLKPRGVVHYKVMAYVNGNVTVICQGAIVFCNISNVLQNTKYTFWAVAFNIGETRYESKRSNNATVITPSFTPSAARSLVTSNTIEGVRLSWTESEFRNGVAAYDLFGSVNGTTLRYCSNCGVSYVFSNPSTINVNYTFWVVAFNIERGFRGPPSQSININSSIFVPSPPCLTDVNITESRLSVSWNKSDVAVGDVNYKLFSTVNNTKNVICDNCAGVLNYSTTNIQPDANYTIFVIAYNFLTGFQSGLCSAVHVYSPKQAPKIPESVMAPVVNDSSALISWEPPSSLPEDDNNTYKVTLYDSRRTISSEIVKKRIFKFTNLTQFTRYYVTVQVLMTHGFGPRSSPLVIQTADENECVREVDPCGKHSSCINSLGSYFCFCSPGYVGNGMDCKALPPGISEDDFCQEESSRNIIWKKTFHGFSDKNLCPNGTVGISTRECLKSNTSSSFWSDPNLSNCVSIWMSALDDKLADHTLNSTEVGGFFLNLLKENTDDGLYGGDVIKSVDVVDTLYNKGKENELNPQNSDAEISISFVKKLVNITERLLEPDTLSVWKDLPKEQRTGNAGQITTNMENIMIESATLVNESLIQNEYITAWYGDTENLNSTDNDSHNTFEELKDIRLPDVVHRKRRNISGKTNIAIVKYKTIAEVLSVGKRKQRNSGQFLNAPVLSVVMNPPLPVPFKEPFEFLLKNQKDGDFEKQECVFFNISRYPGFWSSNGCEVVNVTGNHTICRCDHMTSFSVLMQVRDIELSYTDQLILGWITRIGLCISLVALGCVFLTFICLPRPFGIKSSSACFRMCDQGYRPTYLKKVRSSIHANLVFSLAVSEALFLWGIDKTDDKTTCYAVAVSLHYLLLVAFFWMAAEGVILYLVLVKVFQRKSSRKDKRMFFIICWGAPVAIVSISLALGYENYLHKRSCWLSVEHGLIWGFIGPAVAIMMLNMFFLCCTFLVMSKRTKKWQKADKPMVEKIRYWSKGAAIVSCVLGITWIFGIFFVHEDSVVVAYLFNIFNVFQGLFIFVFHCLLDEKIRQQYHQILCFSVGHSRSGSYSTGVGKKEKRTRSTFNSWLWSVVPGKHQGSGKSDSFPTVADNMKIGGTQPSFSQSVLNEHRVSDSKLHPTQLRNMSSIYHDSDENMDNIPDKILTVKHSRPKNEECNEEEDFWIGTLSRENSDEFIEIPETTCAECLYEVREWIDLPPRKTERKTNSLHESQLRKLTGSCQECKHNRPEYYQIRAKKKNDSRESDTGDSSDDKDSLSMAV